MKGLTFINAVTYGWTHAIAPLRPKPSYLCHNENQLNPNLVIANLIPPYRPERMSHERTFWVWPNNIHAVTTALEANISHFLFMDPQLQEQCSDIARFNSTFIGDDYSFPGGIYVPLRCPDDVTALMNNPERHGIVIIDPQDWKQIPAENLIAAFQQGTTELLVVVDSAEEAETMFTSLQRGVDGCVLRTTDLSQISSFAALMQRINSEVEELSGEPLCRAEITRISTVGVGQRVCVDTCSILQENEGLLVGSSSQALYLVLSEAASVGYAPSRPFRVNAGPVHSYCLVPGGKTRYLCELKAGDPILIASNGSTSYRTAIIGRCKIETRPLLMIETKLMDKNEGELHYNLFVQNAETVRLGVLDSEGKPGMKSVCALDAGDCLLVRSDTAARHIGIRIEEYLVEK